MEVVSEDLLREIIVHLDAISTIRFLRTQKRFWKIFRTPFVYDRIEPYKQYTISRRWNTALLVAVSNNNIAQVEFFIGKGADNMNQGLYEATIIGNTQMVHLFIEYGACRWNNVLDYASFYRRFDLIAIFMKNGAGDINRAMRQAAKGGHKDVIEFFMDRGATQWNEGLMGSLEGMQKSKTTEQFARQKDLMHLFIDLGADDWKSAAILATRAGSQELLDFFVQKMLQTNTMPHGEPFNIFWSDVLEASAASGNLELLRYCSCFSSRSYRAEMAAVAHGHVHLEVCFSYGFWSWFPNAAAKSGNRELFDKYMSITQRKNLTQGLIGAFEVCNDEFIKIGLTKKVFNVWNTCLHNSAKHGRKDLVEICISRGAKDWNAGAHGATVGGYMELVRYFVEELGATNHDGNFVAAAFQGDLRMMKYFVAKRLTKWDACIRNALRIARQKQHNDIIQYLLDMKSSHQNRTE